MEYLSFVMLSEKANEVWSVVQSSPDIEVDQQFGLSVEVDERFRFAVVHSQSIAHHFFGVV